MAVSTLIAGLLLAGSPALYAQVVPVPPLTQMDWQLRTVRASGQPVIPIFEGWYTNEDGTYDLCFGFFNLNREESLDIPIGENNFIEPSRFNGLQPTHFSALGWGDNSGRPGRMVREYCVFVVNVPSDIGSERVWWNLQIDGQTYKVPGHITSRPWNVDNLVNSVGTSVMDFDQDAIQGVLTAPIVRFIEPAEAATRGKGGVTVGPFTTRVGAPLALTISVTHPDEGTVAFGDLDPDEEGVLVEQSLKWSQFSGPAAMTSFRPQLSRFEVGPEPTEQTTEVTFDQPGDYVLLVQVLNGSFSSQCCWTNARVNVTVTP